MDSASVCIDCNWAQEVKNLFDFLIYFVLMLASMGMIYVPWVQQHYNPQINPPLFPGGDVNDLPFFPVPGGSTPVPPPPAPPSPPPVQPMQTSIEELYGELFTVGPE
jgi:hypothetical protein